MTLEDAGSRAHQVVKLFLSLPLNSFNHDDIKDIHRRCLDFKKKRKKEKGHSKSFQDKVHPKSSQDKDLFTPSQSPTSTNSRIRNDTSAQGIVQKILTGEITEPKGQQSVSLATARKLHSKICQDKVALTKFALDPDPAIRAEVDCAKVDDLELSLVRDRQNIAEDIISSYSSVTIWKTFTVWQAKAKEAKEKAKADQGSESCTQENHSQKSFIEFRYPNNVAKAGTALRNGQAYEFLEEAATDFGVAAYVVGKSSGKWTLWKLANILKEDSELKDLFRLLSAGFSKYGELVKERRTKRPDASASNTIEAEEVQVAPSLNQIDDVVDGNVDERLGPDLEVTSSIADMEDNAVNVNFDLLTTTTSPDGVSNNLDYAMTGPEDIDNIFDAYMALDETWDNFDYVMTGPEGIENISDAFMPLDETWSDEVNQASGVAI